ncbi:CPXCG motif-containing cysteine-rich protein [Luteitalea sp.]|uniref:CPXCG motif-containing cysteine-rich protein n=1 Tax=Luteitalea sp. TaxID=2004800 RepID=UPI0025B7BB40|nr:CPXCG motif-containing cysteine-rich protein [Luteitalea sp.]
MDIESSCPYCGESITLSVDVTAGRRQIYVEDCWVCCRPMDILVTVHSRDDVDVEVRASDE